MLKILRSRRVEDEPDPSCEVSGEAGPVPAVAPLGYRALIVDDSLTNRFVLEAAVRRCGVESVQAEDGGQAMQLFDEHADLRLIFLDWMMPSWSGIDVCRYIRQHERGASTYVILVTSRCQKEDLRTGLANGADEFLTKPVDPVELELRIKTGMRLLSMQRRLERNVAELQQALDEVRSLRTLLPMCMYCKSVRDDEGYWDAVDAYLARHNPDLTVSHGICPTCYEAQLRKLAKG